MRSSSRSVDGECGVGLPPHPMESRATPSTAATATAVDGRGGGSAATAGAATEAELRASVAVLDCVNAVFHCLGASHQFDRLYKDGRFDDCGRQRRELSLCVQLRFASPGEPTRAILAQLARTDVSPTEGVVWARRDGGGGGGGDGLA